MTEGLFQAAATVGVHAGKLDGVMVSGEAERTRQGTTHVGEFILECVPEIAQRNTVVVVVVIWSSRCSSNRRNDAVAVGFAHLLVIMMIDNDDFYHHLISGPPQCIIATNLLP